MKSEFFWRTSRGATSMIFFDKKKATDWRTKQEETFGNQVAPAELVERVTTIKEIVHVVARSPETA